MTTSTSPKAVLHAQARKIASQLKAMRKPEKDLIKFGIVMDDKTLAIELSWREIVVMPVNHLEDMIYNEMSGGTHG